jgi:tetratricopeptide (TPR) repeat protein
MKTLSKFPLITVIVLLVFSEALSQYLRPEDIYNRINGSLLFTTSYNEDGYIESWGSAVVINSDGTVYTCFHLYENAEKIILEKDGRKINDAIIIGADPEKDVLLLKIAPGNYPDLTIGDSDSLKIGEEVYALGNPRCYKNSFSSGIISSIRTDGTDKENKQIQFTASISHGSSGGALFNSRAELVGITYMIDTQGQNINFAIPVNYYRYAGTVDYQNVNQVNAITAYCKGYSSYKSGGYYKANEHFNQYLEIFPENTGALLQSAENYLSRGDNDSAIVRSGEVISRYPCNKFAYKLRADAYSNKDDTVNAIDDYNKAIQIDSIYYSAWIARAFYNHHTLKRYNAALEDYNSAINLRPEYSFLYKYRGELYLEKGDTDKAILDLTYSVNPEIDLAETCYDRGIIFSRLERHEDAIFDFSNAIKKDPYNSDYYFSRAFEYAKSNQHINAISDYREVIRMSARNSSAINNLAYSHFHLKEFDEAIINFERALFFDEHQFDSYLGLAMISFLNKKTTQSINYLKKAVKIEPLIRKGLKGIAMLEIEGYLWSDYEKSILGKIFNLAGYKNWEKPPKRKKALIAN